MQGSWQKNSGNLSLVGPDDETQDDSPTESPAPKTSSVGAVQVWQV